MQSKNRAKCCKNTAVISRRVRLELSRIATTSIHMKIITQTFNKEN